MITRTEACGLLRERGFSSSLIIHALASEAVLAAMANRLGENAELWGLTGLLHDLDYPETMESPEHHGIVTATLLTGKLPEEAVEAIKRHNSQHNGCAPETRFDYALRCGETVTGLIHAASLMRPTGYEGMQVKSIKKKMKDKAFAASVNREIIRECEKIGLTLDEFLELAIDAMSKMPDQL